MPERERVRKAIEAPVAEAAKLLEESSGADVETRLAMLVDGWGRGLAAGLEELAIAVGELRRATAPEEPSAPPEVNPTPVAEDGAAAAPDRPEPEARDEEELRAEAARSREATNALRAEREAS